MDKKQKIKIIVSGPVNSGKSTIAMIIKLALKAAGIDFDIEGTIEEHEDKGQEACILNNFPDKVDRIKSKVQVTINQTNTRMMNTESGETYYKSYTPTHRKRTTALEKAVKSVIGKKSRIK